MRKSAPLLLLLAILSAVAAPVRFGFGTHPAATPLNLPLVQSTSGTFTFLGSFKAASFVYTSGGASVSGSTLYLSGLYYDPNDNGLYVPGLGSVTIPTLSGTPAYDGSNGTATTIVKPIRTVSYVANASYTLTGAPVTGATTATFSGSPPAGIAANAGWLIGFETSGATCPSTTTGAHLVVAKVTGWDSGTATATFAALPAATYLATACVHQWNPAYPWGNAEGDRIEGSLLYGGNLYITGRAVFDAGCSLATGWILSANSDLSGWGTPNTAAGQATQVSRRYAGAMNLVPAIWQPYLGGPVYLATGISPSITECQNTIGYGFMTFDPTTVSPAGGSVAINTLQDYPYTGILDSAIPQSQELANRSFTGPFPTSGVGPSLTLTAPPTGGTTSVALSAAWNTPAGWKAPSTRVQMTFSDGETRIGHAHYNCAVFPALDNSCSAGSFAALTCSPSCTANVTVKLYGDAWASEYDGAVGGAIIVPSSRSILYISEHQYGPHESGFGFLCYGGSSGSNSAPIAPDTIPPDQLQITAFDLLDLYHAKIGVASDTNCPTVAGTVGTYAACPYSTWAFPGWQNMAKTVYGPNCAGQPDASFMAYDNTSHILYIVHIDASQGSINIVNEFRVNAP